MAEAVPFKKVEQEVNADAVRLVEQTLERVRAGDVVSVAIVEVRRAGAVSVGWCKSDHYHGLNSGASRLATQLASIPDED